MPAKSLYATMKPLKGQEQFVRNAISEMAEHVRKEPGNVRFEVYHRDDGTIVVEETYKDESAFKAHMGYAHGKKFNSSIVDKVEGGASDVVFLTPINTTL
ncbi:(ZYRO0G02750g) [Zygosaccharomyces parabailii]|uniref:Putative monooxygenase ycnE n=1 Tax=Zeugodacus cucurbitae TaxID=28588 RepID=A0A0A1XMF8_ZEUCU|nr:(ZYRO0G02750g) [Zygosaccharomyces parabailii]CDH16093.1 uncharacterized protein ZBAI_07881 [Zygosaccharomyces bailii ISA1307]SJM83159.1 uncharacterized protein ZBIST_0876 [Zygosaccharomyces bailii]